MAQTVPQKIVGETAVAELALKIKQTMQTKIEFNSEYSSTNKAATMSDINTAIYNAIGRNYSGV